MRVLILSQGFNPEPHFKGLSFARELMRQGFEVQVLTGFPNYPGGKVYPGYKIKLIQKEVIEGVEIIRVPLYPSHDFSPLKRIATYISFALSAAFIGVWFVRRADILYIYQPPASTPFGGLMLRLFKAKRAVLDIQDLWPDTLQATGMMNSSLLLKIVGAFCKFTYSWVDHIVVLSDGFKKCLIERGVPENKITTIYNWADESAEKKYIPDQNRARDLGLLGKFTILFAGQMGKAQGLDSVIDAAKIVSKTHPDIQFAFIGGGIERDRLQRRVISEAIPNVIFLERVPITDIGNILALADVLLVHLKNDPLFEITIPSKTQGYLASGKPIIMAVPGESAEIIDRARAGVSCKPDDPDALAIACINLSHNSPTERAEMSKNGLEFYRKEMSLSVGVSKFTKIFKDL
ncbi:MAG: glycosyltransferase family 4 protein [Xanthomonadaceae bacterium]|nr:glycosyltransferase family 4 protein [Xanthomonadaceae bacterium]